MNLRAGVVQSTKVRVVVGDWTAKDSAEGLRRIRLMLKSGNGYPAALHTPEKQADSCASPQGRERAACVGERSGRVRLSVEIEVKQSKFVYYADMLIYPGIIIGFLLQDLVGKRFALHPDFWLAFLAG